MECVDLAVNPQYAAYTQGGLIFVNVFDSLVVTFCNDYRPIPALLLVELAFQSQRPIECRDVGQQRREGGVRQRGLVEADLHRHRRLDHE